MKKHFSILIVCLILSMAYNVYGQTPKAADLWVPGPLNSFWEYRVYYNTSTGNTVTDTYNSNITLGGKTYKSIQESKPFVGDIIGAKPDPFVTFREDETGNILGYGRAANSDIEEVFKRFMEENGTPRQNVQFAWASNEWVLLPASMNKPWNITEANISVVFPQGTVNGKYALQGEVHSVAWMRTIAGSFTAITVYLYDYSEIGGSVSKYLYAVMWLVPDVGLVQFGSNAYNIAGELSNYGKSPIVTPINDPPVVSDIPDQTVEEGKPFASVKLDDFVTDPDNTDAEITWSVTGNVNVTVTIGVDRVAVIGVKDAEWNGNETITFTATDPGGLSASDSAKFTLTPINDPPVVSDIKDQTVDEGKPFAGVKLDDFITDPDNADAEITWSVTGNVNITVTIDVDRVAVIGVKDAEWNGNEAITFTAKDPGGLSASDTAKFTVTPINDSPVVSNIPDQTIEEGKAFANIKFDDFVTDPDNRDEELKWTYSGNTKLSITMENNRVVTIVSSDPKWSGNETVTFTVTDPGGLSASDTVKFTITPINDPPVASDIPDQTVEEGKPFASVKLDDFVADPDNTDAEITWSVTGNVNVTVTIGVDHIAVIGVKDAEWNGNEAIIFTAKDPGGLSASDFAKFTVTPINDPPVVSDIKDQTVDEGKPFAGVKLDDFVTDPDNTDAEMTWSVTGNVNITVTIDVDRVAVIGVKDAEWNGNETIIFAAKDPGGLSASDTAKFTVTPINDPPVMSNIPDQTVEEGKSFASVKLDDFVTDPDNTDAEITWSVTGNVNVTVTIGVDRVAVIGVKDAEWNGNETITFTAKDPGGLSAGDIAKFTIIPINDSPVITDIPDQSIAAGQNFVGIKLDDYIADPDNADNEINWSFSGNVNLLIAIDANRTVEITILDKDWRGSEVITFTAKDPAGLTVSDKVKLEAKILLGDMNKDNKLGSNDAIIMLQISAKVKEPNDYEKIAGDINGDGKIMSNDAIILLRIVVGLGAPDINSLTAARKPVNFAMPELHGMAGDVLMLPLEIDNTQNLAGGDIQIAYNGSIIQAIEVSSVQDIAMISNINQKGVIRIAFAGSSHLDNKTLANVKFRVITDAVSPIKVESINLYGFDGNPLEVKHLDREFRSWAVAPEKSALIQNYPNPFNPVTWIPFQLKDSANVEICIYSLSGELVRELDLGYKSAGVYVSSDRAGYWDGKDHYGISVASGIYFYTINAGGFSAVKKLVIQK